jgi:hypothetical protein
MMSRCALTLSTSSRDIKVMMNSWEKKLKFMVTTPIESRLRNQDSNLD